MLQLKWQLFFTVHNYIIQIHFYPIISDLSALVFVTGEGGLIRLLDLFIKQSVRASVGRTDKTTFIMFNKKVPVHTHTHTHTDQWSSLRCVIDPGERWWIWAEIRPDLITAEFTDASTDLKKETHWCHLYSPLCPTYIYTLSLFYMVTHYPGLGEEKNPLRMIQIVF